MTDKQLLSKTVKLYNKIYKFYNSKENKSVVEFNRDELNLLLCIIDVCLLDFKSEL